MLKNIVNLLINIEFFDKLINWLTEIAYKIISLKNYVEYKKTDAFTNARNHVKQEVVAHGPFKGLNYEGIATFCSTIYPKLVGTYESELHETIEDIINKKYQRLIDIGSAEGYYAVGIPYAMKDVNVEIIAIEISQIAVKNLKKLIVNNRINNKFEITDKLNTAKYIDNKKTLVIIDCEGAELEYLKLMEKECLVNWDFLIEVHVQIKKNIMKEIIDIFPGRNIKKIKSIDDYHKIEEMSCMFPSNFDDNTKLLLLSENRRTGMYWLSVT